MTNHMETTPYIVCPTCKGEGRVGPGHVYTQADIDEYGVDEFWDLMHDYREGKYDVLCDNCQGRRVVRDECACLDCEAERQEIWELEALERAERAFGC